MVAKTVNPRTSEFEASQGYTEKPCIEKPKKKRSQLG